MSEPAAPAPAPAPASPAAPRRDPVAAKILELVTAAGIGESVRPLDVAHAIAEERRKPSDPKELWHRYLQAVNEQARALARAGEIEILRKGRVVDSAKPIKGVIKLTLPGGTWKAPKDVEAEDEA